MKRSMWTFVEKKVTEAHSKRPRNQSSRLFVRYDSKAVSCGSARL